MDVLKEYVENINFHWIVIVMTGLYIHLRQICFIGLCFDEDNEDKSPLATSYASVIFLFSALCLLAEYRLWPRSLKEPPIHLLFIYEIFVSALVTNLTMCIIWAPLVHGILCLTKEASKWLFLLNKAVGFPSYSHLMTLANYMSTDMAAAHAAFCLAILSFVWMLDATESLDGMIEMLAKNDSLRSFQKTSDKVHRRIRFSNPEVTDTFFYSLCRQCFDQLNFMRHF